MDLEESVPAISATPGSGAADSSDGAPPSPVADRVSARPSEKSRQGDGSRRKRRGGKDRIELDHSSERGYSASDRAEDEADRPRRRRRTEHGGDDRSRSRRSGTPSRTRDRLRDDRGDGQSADSPSSRRRVRRVRRSKASSGRSSDKASRGSKKRKARHRSDKEAGRASPVAGGDRNSARTRHESPTVVVSTTKEAALDSSAPPTRRGIKSPSPGSRSTLRAPRANHHRRRHHEAAESAPRRRASSSVSSSCPSDEFHSAASRLSSNSCASVGDSSHPTLAGNRGQVGPGVTQTVSAELSSWSWSGQ